MNVISSYKKLYLEQPKSILKLIDENKQLYFIESIYLITIFRNTTSPSGTVTKYCLHKQVVFCDNKLVF